MTSHRWLFPLVLCPLVAGCTPTGPKAPASQHQGEPQPVEAEPEPGPEPEPRESAPEPEPRPGVSHGLISAQFIPQYDTVYAGRGGAQQLNVLIKLSAGADEDAAAARPALDLAVVLDRSGSMSGDKLRFAKQAGLDLLGRLSDRDRVTLITYDDVVDTHSRGRAADRKGVVELRGALLAVSPGGTTALGPALFRGLESVGQGQGRGKAQQLDRLAHVVLLSDGVANHGETRPEVIGARVARKYGQGTTVSSLGMGLDYNEDLMTKIADEGGGRYHFIEDAEHIPAVLADEFAGLTSTVASEVAVEFDAAEPTRVDEVHGYISSTQADITDIRVGYLGSGQTREIIAQVHVPPSQLRGQPGDELELGMITVRFRPVDPDAAKNQAGEAPLVELKLPATVTLGASDQEVWSSEHTEVTVRVAEVESAATLQAASVAVDRGDFVGAQQILGDAEAELGSKLDNARSEAEKLRIEEELAEMRQAKGALTEAQQSAAERKKYSKRYKASSYAKGKGSKKKRK